MKMKCRVKLLTRIQEFAANKDFLDLVIRFVHVETG